MELFGQQPTVTYGSLEQLCGLLRVLSVDRQGAEQLALAERGAREPRTRRQRM